MTPGQKERDMKSLASEIIEKIAPSLGIQVDLEPTYRYVGRLIAPDGRKFYFRNTNFDLNGQGSAEMAKDKDYAAYFMKLMGYPVPESQSFYSDDWCRILQSDQNIDKAYEYAHQLGFPVFVKPNSKSQGSGVAKVYNKKEFYPAMRRVFNKSKDRVGLVQKPIEGQDFRIVVLDDEIISAYQRFPLQVTGDGQSPIMKLILEKQQRFDQEGRDTRIPFDDPRIITKLRRIGLDFNYILSSREKIFLLDNANLSTGGEAIDVTNIIHPQFSELAIRLVRDMGLRYCGVDLITADPIDQPPNRYTLLEINAAPGVDHYAMVGREQRLLVEEMYEKILLAIIKS